jgi:hypothetical protein
MFDPATKAYIREAVGPAVLALLSGSVAALGVIAALSGHLWAWPIAVVGALFFGLYLDVNVADRVMDRIRSRRRTGGAA